MSGISRQLEKPRGIPDTTVLKILAEYAFAAVKGAPETIKGLASISNNYDETHKWITRHGCHMLAPWLKGMDRVLNAKIAHLVCKKVESDPQFAGFLIFHCPPKDNTVEEFKLNLWLIHHIRCFNRDT